MILGSTHDERIQLVSVFHTVERLNKHLAFYLNFLNLFVESKGMLFTVDKAPLAKGEFTSSRDRETDYKIQTIVNAPIITPEEYEELKTKNKAGRRHMQRKQNSTSIICLDEGNLNKKMNM